MNKSLIALVGVFCVQLASCNAGGTGAGGHPINSASIIQEAQSEGARLCGFVPTEATIVGILKLGNPALASGTQIASVICNALDQRENAVADPAGKTIAIEGVRVRRS